MSMVQVSRFTGAVAEPTKRAVPAESTKFGNGINVINPAITLLDADARSDPVRTRLLSSSPWRCRRPSYEKKKKVLFLTIRPPTFPPNWLRLNGGGVEDASVKKLRASRASLR